MYKEVAFDPSCMADIEYYNLVKQHFGYENGRYISADIKAWAREAMSRVKESDLTTIRKQSVKNFLNKLGRSKTSKEFLLTRDRQGIKAGCWQDWIDEQQRIRQFSCAVSDAIGDGGINIDQINDGCDQWIVPTSISVRRDPKSIIGAIHPLIVLSDRLTVIDQYFRLSENPVLVELFTALKGTSVRSLRIATSMETKDLQSVYDRKYRSVHSNSILFEWIRAPERCFHDRYVISEVGAVRSGQGFMADAEKGIHSDLANINIIGYQEASRTLRELDQLLDSGKASVELSV